MLFTETSGRFSPGRLIASEDLLACVAKEELLNAYCHHLNCDWGDVPDSVQQRRTGPPRRCYSQKNIKR